MKTILVLVNFLFKIFTINREGEENSKKEYQDGYNLDLSVGGYFRPKIKNRGLL